MPSSDVIEVLGDWEGYGVGFVKRQPPASDRSPPVLWIELIRRNGPMVCSGCGEPCDRYHD